MQTAPFFKELVIDTLGRNTVFLDSVDSTSSYLRRIWRETPHGTVVLAAEQLGGRGRSGKSFVSPRDQGMYLSFLLSDLPFVGDTLFTVRVSYAVCRALDAVTDTAGQIGIKWVNDLYYDDRKIGGILCESLHDGSRDAILVGVGINLDLDRGMLPRELHGQTASLRELMPRVPLPQTVAAAVLNAVEDMYFPPRTDEDFLALYRSRSVILDRDIRFLRDGKWYNAHADGIGSDGALLVTLENGEKTKLASGEVTVRY